MPPTDPRILALHKAAWDFADGWHGEDEVLSTARLRASEIGCQVVSPGAGSLLSTLAAAIGATAAVEVGTGAGVSAVRLLEGMTEDGVVTSIDNEAEHQVIARETVAAAGFAAGRIRLINGPASEVLGRLTDGAYDIVLLATRASDAGAHIERAHDLLRAGGLLVINRALAGDKVADPAARDGETVAMREALATVHADERFTSVLLPVGGGVLVATKRRS